LLIDRQTFLAAAAETKFFRFTAGTAVFLPIVDCSSDCQRTTLLAAYNALRQTPMTDSTAVQTRRWTRQEYDRMILLAPGAGR
jgi:hypothetical protein